MSLLRGAGLIGGIAWITAREIERKTLQRRDDPDAFRRTTPSAYLGGLAIGTAAYALFGPRLTD